MNNLDSIHIMLPQRKHLEENLEYLSTNQNINDSLNQQLFNELYTLFKSLDNLIEIAIFNELKINYHLDPEQKEILVQYLLREKNQTIDLYKKKIDPFNKFRWKEVHLYD